jgi:hypothetical protein
MPANYGSVWACWSLGWPLGRGGFARVGHVGIHVGCSYSLPLLSLFAFGIAGEIWWSCGHVATGRVSCYLHCQLSVCAFGQCGELLHLQCAEQAEL